MRVCVQKIWAKHSILFCAHRHTRSFSLFLERANQLKKLFPFVLSQTRHFNFNSLAIQTSQISHIEKRTRETKKTTRKSCKQTNKQRKNISHLNFYWIVSSKYHDFQVIRLFFLVHFLLFSFNCPNSLCCF